MVLAGGLGFGVGPEWRMLFFYHINVAVGIMLPKRDAYVTIAAIAVFTLVAGASTGFWWLTAPAIAIGLWSTTFVGQVAAVAQLKAAREELARLAVSEERLRFARDLHDLLGHSLSLITLKSELAERLLPETPENRKAIEEVRGLPFSIGTTELVIVGLLPEVSADLRVTIPTAGLLVTGYALGVVFGGPLLTAATIRVPKKQLLLALMAVFVAGNALAALAPGYAAMMAGRVVSSLAHGAFFGVAIAVVVGLVPEGRRGTAIGLVVTGLTVSTMSGVPMGALLGQRLGWEAAFWMVAALGTAGAAGIALLVPRDREETRPDLRAELAAVARPQVLLSLAMMAVGFGGVFTSFTYIAPLLRDVGGFSPGAVSALLVLIGAGSVVGTLVGGNLADRHPNLTLGASFAALALVLLAFVFTIHNQVMTVANVFLFGVVGYAAMPGLQVRILRKAGDAPTLSATATASAFNVGNAGGAFLGGAVIDAGLGLGAVNWSGALVAACGVLVTVRLRGRPLRDPARRRGSAARQVDGQSHGHNGGRVGRFPP